MLHHPRPHPLCVLFCVVLGDAIVSSGQETSLWFTLYGVSGFMFFLEQGHG